MSPAIPRPPAVGIDLGTTFSAVAHLDETGRPVTIVNAEGDLTTPSVVLFDGPDVIVGKEAVKAMGTESHRIADIAKRDMGKRAYRKIIDGREYPPEVVQACILKKIRDDVERRIGTVKKVVVTVPAFFDEVRRKATQDAGAIAGLEIIDIINEPTAAAVAFGFQQGFLNPQGEAARDLKVLVYDLGGGTFDVTLMDIKGRNFTAIATDGDVELGGRDFDSRIMNHVAEQFMRQYGADPRTDVDVAARMWRDCEDAKRTLSARARASVAVDMGGKALRVEITRDLFKELTHDLIDRTQFTTRQLLKSVGLDWGAVDRVLLVGGSSRMPMVKEMLTQLTGRPPDDSVSADEAVCHGAALRAGLILDTTSGVEPMFKVKNVNSHSLGVLGISRETGMHRNVILIPRNTALPVTAKRTFKTQKPNQKSVKVTIVEGESQSPDACTTIGECVIKDLPPGLPALTPIDVYYHYAENGRLSVSIKVPGTDVRVEQTIDRENGLSKEQIDAWAEWVKNPS
ncbi:MAG TPA: Hsp70 family protein [Pirellulales bacterium]